MFLEFTTFNDILYIKMMYEYKRQYTTNDFIFILNQLIFSAFIKSTSTQIFFSKELRLGEEERIIFKSYQKLLNSGVCEENFKETLFIFDYSDNALLSSVTSC